MVERARPRLRRPERKRNQGGAQGFESRKSKSVLHLRRPLLTTRLTFVPAGCRVCARGRSDITWPFGTNSEKDLLTRPTEQSERRMARFAPGSFFPMTYGTTQCAVPPR